MAFVCPVTRMNEQVDEQRRLLKAAGLEGDGEGRRGGGKVWIGSVEEKL